MADQILTRIILRNDTEAAWSAANPVLKAGELAISNPELQEDGSYSLPKFKLGIDGVKTWSQIEYCIDTTDLLLKITAINGRIDDVVAQLEGLSTVVGAPAEGEEAATGLYLAIAEEIAARAQADTELEAALKAYVAEEIGKQIHLTTKVVDSIDAVDTPNVLYLIKDNTVAEGKDAYAEYLLIDGNPVKIGTTETSLTGYITQGELTTALEGKVDKVDGKGLSSNDFTTAEKTKLENIAANAEVNVIEKVQIAGVDLSITDKTVNIPVGGESLGVVKSSTAENEVAISSEGKMSVNSLNVNKLVQTEGDVLIIYGGSATE